MGRMGLDLRLPAPATIKAHGNNYFCDCGCDFICGLSVIISVIPKSACDFSVS